MEQTLVLIKPHALREAITGDVFEMLEIPGIQRVTVRSLTVYHEVAEAHFAEHRDRPGRVFERNYNSFIHEPVVVAVLQGEDAVARIRALVGPTDPSKAAPDTIRGRFSKDSIDQATREDRGLHNVIHASDSPEAAQREIANWFQEAPDLLRVIADAASQTT